jgi:tetratricopeptide (TPR) repeat protein
MATGKEAEAQAALERAVLLSPDSAYSLNALGALHERRGDALQAAAWYSRALAKDPEYREARENLARIGEGGGGR